MGPPSPSRHRFGAVPAPKTGLVDVAGAEAAARQPAFQVRRPGAVVAPLQEPPAVRARGEVETDAAEVPAAPTKNVVEPTS